MSLTPLSIITTVHDIPGNMLEKCIISVINQEYSNFEYFIILDNVSKAIERLVRNIVSTDSRAIILTADNNSYGMSFNQALMLASGDYIGIVDGDDYPDFNLYSSLMDTADRTKANVVKGNVLCHYDDGAKPLDITEEVKKDNWKFTWQHWSAIYNRLFLLQHGLIMYPDTIKNNESLFLTKLGVWNKNMQVIPEVYYNYCRRLDSLDSNYLIKDKIFQAFNVRMRSIDFMLMVRTGVSLEHLTWVIQEHISRMFIESTRIRKSDYDTRNLAAWYIISAFEGIYHADKVLYRFIENSISERMNIPKDILTNMDDIKFWIEGAEYIPPIV